MGYGSQQAIEDAEDDFEESQIELILEIAADLLIHAQQHNTGLSESEALQKAENFVELEANADADPSGVARIEADHALPELAGLKRAPGQTAAIKARLRDVYDRP
ncbi:hypothetical protein [Stenotrophomonas rhizophila]|uniref:hypothetical protein n=1 Tax=Stenotrophomonas rhizophila TaxID=216778 RepID=UPI0028B22F9B|nr:hypothetical protein [Stenotrophomonas rhizophila]